MFIAGQSSKIVMPEELYHGTVMKRGSMLLQTFQNKLLDKAHWKLGKDFGQGFYLTHLIEQAKDWGDKARKRALRAGSADDLIPCVLHVELGFGAVRIPEILVFTDASKVWAKFILENRLYTPVDDPVHEGIDIIIGYMADNDTSDLVSKYKYDDGYTFDDFYEDIMKRDDGTTHMTMDQLGNQYSFCSEDMNNALKIVGCFIQEEEEWAYYGIEDPYLSAIGLL